jgi:pSer/pThr/pTyr-binding forkhead associated (FHA) protein
MPMLFIYSRKGECSLLSLKGKRIAMGRSSENDVIVKDPYSSNLHAFIYPSERGYVIRDNSSKNGTFLNGERIRGEVDLKRGDEVLIGSTRIMFDKEMSTNVEITRRDSAITNIRTILPLKDALKKTDISTTIKKKEKNQIWLQ